MTFTVPLPFQSDFNPRTREGCDGTTDERAGSGPNFNPRTREGCDQELRQQA